MPSTLQLVIDLLQLGPHPFRLGLAPNPEPPLPPGRTDVRETQAGERLRLTQPPRPTTFGRVASEFDQPRLVRVNLQTELGERVAKRDRYASRSRSTSTWCNSAVNRASLSRTATCRTRSSALGASCPALCPGRVLLAVFPLVDPLSSTGSAVATATLFVGFAGTTGPSDFPHPFIPGLPPRRSLGVPHDDQKDGARDLPVLPHEG